MGKLELKHIVGYLPYKLGVLDDEGDRLELISIDMSEEDFCYSCYSFKPRMRIDFMEDNLKPILRPISSITKQEAYQLGVLITNKNEMADKTVGIGKITVGEWEVPIINYTDIDGEEYSFMVMFCNHGISATNDNNMTFEAYEWLYENHFDIHGLIEQGLAIDVNTL